MYNIYNVYVAMVEFTREDEARPSRTQQKDVERDGRRERCIGCMGLLIGVLFDFFGAVSSGCIY